MPRGIKTPVSCPDCGGLGVPYCSACNGNGCDACDGSGRYDDTCATCGGSGQIKPQRKRKQKVRIVDVSVTDDFIATLHGTLDAWQGLKRFIEDKRGCETESLYNLVMSKEYGVFCQFNHVMKQVDALLDPYR